MNFAPFRLFKPNSHSLGGATAGAGQRRHSFSKWIQVDVKQALVSWMAEKKFGSSKKIALMIEAVDGNGMPSKDAQIETALKETDVNNVSATPTINEEGD